MACHIEIVQYLDGINSIIGNIFDLGQVSIQGKYLLEMSFDCLGSISR